MKTQKPRLLELSRVRAPQAPYLGTKGISPTGWAHFCLHLPGDPAYLSFTRRGRRQSDFRVGPDPLVSDPGLRLNTACPVWAGLGILAEG